MVAGAIVRVGSLRLLPLERVVVVGAGDEAAAWIVARRDPWALVIQDAAGTRALAPDGRPIPLEAARRRVPGLDGMLAGYPSGLTRRPR
jgi:hypothetical protein